MIPEQTIAEIRDRASISDIVGQHVTLKRSGHSLKGLCPFHDEKTPSFYVHPDRGFYHCFGCGVSGDVFSFLMHVEGKGFVETARDLSELTGVELPSFDPQADAAYQRKKSTEQRLASLMDVATRFYEQALHSHEHAGLARKELKERGVTRATAKEFSLGFAPPGWDNLVKHLDEGGHSPADAESLGLIVRRKSADGYYDRFRHRLMFPIRDLHGRVVAFSGRALDPPPGQTSDGDPPAKYLNSPEGPLYTKSHVLFGLHEARVHIRRQGCALLCEGNFDLVALHQAGHKNAVAPMGTAFTAAHAKLLKRFTERVVLLFDGDAAGTKAIKEAQPLLSKLNMTAGVVSFPAGSDPDTFIREHGADALSERVASAQGIIDFIIDDAALLAAGDPQQKAQAIAALGPVLAKVNSPVEARLYVERVGQKFGIRDLNAVRRELRRAVRNARSAKDVPTPKLQQRRAQPPDTLQSKLISVLIDQPSLIKSDTGSKLHELLTSTDLRAMFEIILSTVNTRGELDAATLSHKLEGHPLQTWAQQRLAVQEHDLQTAQEILERGVLRLTQQNIERQLPQLQQQIVQARRQGDDALAQGLTAEFVALSKSAHKIKQGSFKR